jgi:hypothetical protein
MSRRSSDALGVILAILGVMALLGLGTCVGVYALVKRGTAAVVASMGDAGSPISIVSPAAVTAELSGAKRAYVGAWRSAAGSVLDILPNGQVTYDKREPGQANEKITVAIAAFHGADIELRVLAAIVLNVSVPPRRVGGGWEMVVDGATYTRPGP